MFFWRTGHITDRFFAPVRNVFYTTSIAYLYINVKYLSRGKICYNYMAFIEK